jgi:transcriptional regulator with XRE-family HTH domain
MAYILFRMGKASASLDDPAMAKVREIWAERQSQGMTQQQLGELMGYPEKTARQGVNQFLKSHNPQVASLRRFAKAVGVKVSTLVRE